MGKYDEAEKELAEKHKTTFSRHEFFTAQLRKKFMTLPREQKDFIRQVHAEGLEWKGEDTHKKLESLNGLTHFEHVYSEWKIMKEIGINAYRKRSLDKLGAYTQRSMGSNDTR